MWRFVYKCVTRYNVESAYPLSVLVTNSPFFVIGGSKNSLVPSNGDIDSTRTSPTSGIASTNQNDMHGEKGLKKQLLTAQ